MENLEPLRLKTVRLERLYAELQGINHFEERLEYSIKEMDNDSNSYYFGLRSGTPMNPTDFDLSGSTRYADLTRNIVALARVELNRRKLEIIDELERDFGGIE